MKTANQQNTNKKHNSDIDEPQECESYTDDSKS